MIRNIHLYGPLADLANTKTFELDVDTPVSLIFGLRSQVKGFRKWCDDNKLGIVYTDENNNQVSLDYDTFAFPFSNVKDIHLVPETEGAGAEVAAYLALTGFTAAVVTFAVNLAISLVISSIAQSLAPSPSSSNPQDRPAENPSFIYGGAVNRVEQGWAVPIVYGIHMVGSVVVSAGVDIEEIAYVPPPAPAPAPELETPPWQHGTFGTNDSSA